MTERVVLVELKPERWRVMDSRHGESVLDCLALPTRWRRPRRVRVGNPFVPRVTDETIDLIFAVIASCSPHRFEVECSPWSSKRRAAWFARVEGGAGDALERYATYLRTFHAEHAHAFDGRWGEQVTSPPVGELRFLYDSAAAQVPQRPGAWRPTWPYGEFHWRAWPLDNLAIVEPRRRNGEA